MKTLFDADAATDITRRIRGVTANSPRQWGKMTASQMLAHCANGLEEALGDKKPPRMFVGYLFGGLFKNKLLSEAPMQKNSPTAPTLKIADDRDIEKERTRLIALVERFSGGPQVCTDHPHSFFGKLNAQEWGILMYKHLDHHLTQFSS